MFLDFLLIYIGEKYLLLKFGMKLKNKMSGENKKVFLSEIGWREFSYHLLYNFPNLQEKNLKNNFDSFPWKEDEKLLKKWEKDNTGYPIVDAGMRELWETGYMHNRVRMITSSFLVKNLLLNWKLGKIGFGTVFLMQMLQVTVLVGNGLQEQEQMLLLF